MGLFRMLEISGSALSAERQRAEVVAANMANAETTRTPEGGPFKRKEVVFSNPGGSSFGMHLANFSSINGRVMGGVQVSQVVEDSAPPVMKYEPGHPDANAEGYVAYPNINPIQEMVDLMSSVRAYQLNSSAVAASKQMIQQSLDILK